MSSPTPDPVDVLAADDPVAAVLAAAGTGRSIALRTSGTTGSPRSVVRTTDSWLCSFETVAGLTGLGRGSRMWLPGPMGSTMNLFAAVLAAERGARMVPDVSSATHTHLTPHVLRRLLDGRDTLSGVHVTVAGDRLTPTLRDRACEAGAEVSHYFGAAELSFVAWGSHQDDLRAFPGVEVELRDRVVWVRSPYLAEGYLDGAGPFARDPAGFATVGDRGELTEEGFLRVAGRGEQVVLTGAATVLVADVEAALRAGLTGDVVVLGQGYEPLGEVVVAVLTDPADLERALSAAGRGLDRVQRPRRWFHVPRLPLTEAGKVDRSALRDMLGEAARLSPRGSVR